MKKLMWMVLVLMLGVMVAPAAAQERGSLVDNLAADGSGQFTTLVSALEAAGLADTLSADGDFTVFAPTNDAFDAALESLGISLDALLGDTAMLTQILTYHVVPEDRIFFREFSRTPTATTLEGSDLTLTIVDGVPMVNDVAISGVDRAGDKGVYHIIDSVLLPPDLANTLAATPEATASADVEATPAAEATEMVMDENTAMLRFAFLSPDSPPLILSINGEPAGAGEAVTFPMLTDWIAVPAGYMTISGAPEGEGTEDLLFPFELTLDDATWTTLAIVGSEPNGTFIAQPVLEDYSPIAAGNARVTVFHGIEGAPPIDMTADGQVVVSRLAYPGTRGDNDGAFVIETPAGATDLQIILSGTAATGQSGTVVLVDLADYDLAENNNYFIAAVGTPDEPDVLAEGIDMAELTDAGM